MNDLIGKRIIASEPIYQFNTGFEIGRTRGRFIGIIEEFSGESVLIFNKTNPVNYQHYAISLTDFNKWVDGKLYSIRKAI